MKRMTALLLALLLLTLPALAEPSSLLDYTDDILEDGSPIYYFQELSLKLPADWRGKVMALPGEGGVSFYQIASYEKYQAEGVPGGGFLFILGASVNDSFSEMPAFRYLGFSEASAMNYYLLLPTDYPAYLEEAIQAEYDAMSAQIDEVVKNAEFYGSVGSTVATTEGNLVRIACPEQGFTTMADPNYAWDYQEGTGISIYTQHEGSIPYVIVYRGEDLLGEPYEYIQEQYTPHMQQKYGDALASFEEVRSYETGGKQLPAGLYSYYVGDTLVDMIRLMDSTGTRTVSYTAKFIHGEGEATLAALDAAVRNFRAED